MTTGTKNQTTNSETTKPMTGGTTKPMTDGTIKTVPITAPVSIASTAAPVPTKKPGRKFDGASFGGGFALAAGLVIIAGIIYCVYARRNKTGYDQY
jgi:hypothetical protein